MNLYGCTEELKIHLSLVSIDALELAREGSCNLGVILAIQQQMC